MAGQAPRPQGWQLDVEDPFAADRVVGLYLIIAIQFTSMAMRRLPRPAWRAVHLTSYALVWIVSLHAGLAGSDVENRAYQFVALVLTLGAATAATTRVLHHRRPRDAAEPAPAQAGSGSV